MPELLIDFAIITAIEIERRAVCRALQMTDQDRVRLQTRTYWRKRLPLEDGKFYEIVVAQSPDMGSMSASLLVSDIKQHWKPSAILLVGIAGAASEKQHLGDLVIASDVYYYERGKLTPDGKKPEPYMFKADPTLWDRVNTVAHWTAPISVARPDETQDRPKIYYGVIASGEKVIADAAVRDEVAAGQRKIKAIEMEGYGFSAAIWQSSDQVHHLAIKAICDLADSSKNDEWHEYAAAVAADFTKHFLLDRPLKPRNSPAPQAPPPSQYQTIIDDLKFGNIIPFLGPGINPNLYIQLASHLTRLVEADLLHETSSNASEERNLMQQLIGVPCQFCPYLPTERPDRCPMLEGIERVNTCPLYIEQRLAVAKMNLRYLSQYYKLNRNLGTFYGLLYEIFEAIENQHPNPVHKFFAKLPHEMLSKGYPKRRKKLPYQLIVTTNYDDLLERAFDDAQQPYDVIYYVADGNDRGKYKHKPYKSPIAQIIEYSNTYGDNTYNYDKLPLREHLDNSSEPRPIILKLYGTWENNFVVAEEHLSYLVSSPIKNLPASLLRILQDNSILFLGYSPNDSDLQLIVNRFWKNNKLPGKSWLVHQSQPGNLEQKIWEEQRDVELLSIDCSLEDFVTSLKAEIEKQLSV